MAKRWTQEEMDFLEDKWGVISVKAIAKQLNKSINAVIVKSERMRLGGAYESYLTTNKLGEMFGIHRQTVLRNWITNGGLKATSTPFRSQRIYRVKLEDLVEWLKANQDKWSSNSLELHALGEEFDWLVEKRKLDSKQDNKAREWTIGEYNLLIELSDAGVPLKEIADKLNRTYYSVRRKRQYYLDSKKERAA